MPKPRPPRALISVRIETEARINEWTRANIVDLPDKELRGNVSFDAVFNAMLDALAGKEIKRVAKAPKSRPHDEPAATPVGPAERPFALRTRRT